MINSIIYALSTLSISLLFTTTIGAQVDEINTDNNGFRASILVGANLSQLHGDGSRGFSLVGLSTGLEIDYPISKVSAIGIGLEYQQYGSSQQFTFLDAPDPELIRLHYLSIPLIFRYHTSREVSISGGIVYNQLVSVSTEHPIFASYVEEFESSEIAIRGTLNYQVSRHSSLSIGYESAITDILKSTVTNSLEGLRSFAFKVGYAYRIST